ncbi:MAG: DNA-binding protein HU-beta [Thermomicrobiales bacterium]|jgi:DNA-binding protein HU-beta|nr:DNA-binding protein HU-beta [Thermomicrobiales bacterium]MEA2526284.1 DNA-binding protein HU-beta [Thermomicrobiales bacterium]MEA2584494.1 DNA-binding protein HU-beta [Thermomicrobiales bacterium]MEA2596733.1 DNA-binding protein HU-beta [Thermomicrobiales bacterium]
MRKQDLIRAVAKQTSRPENQVAPIVNAVFDTIEQTLADGDEVAISGFGSFRVVERPARTGRNPQTRQEIMIGPRRTPAFRAGASLKRAVGDTDGED